MNTESSGQVTPYPPRFWWLKRLTLLGIVFLLVVVGLRLWWGYRANTRLAAIIAEIQAAGDPIYFDDIQPPKVQDYDNKLYYFTRAYLMWPVVPGMSVTIIDTDWHREPERYPDPIVDDEAYLAQVESLLPLLEQAAEAPTGGFQATWKQPLIFYLNFSNLRSYRELANLIGDAAKRAADRGDEQLAIRLLAVLPAVSESATTEPASLLPMLVRISTTAMSASAIERILPLLNPPASIDSRRDSPWTAVLNSFADDEPYRATMARVWILERLCMFDVTRGLLDGSLQNGGVPLQSIGEKLRHGLVQVVFGPAIVDDGVDLLHAFTDVVILTRRTSSRKRFWDALTHDPEAFTILSMESRQQLHRPYHATVDLAPTFNDKVFKVYFMGLTMHRLTATALAIKLYEGDHGHRPKALDELVPDYLSQVPEDPWADEGEKLKYRPQGAILVHQTDFRTPSRLSAIGPAIVYSVGLNGIDDHGQVIVGEDGKINDNARHEDEFACDMWFLLDKPHEPYVFEPATSSDE